MTDLQWKKHFEKQAQSGMSIVEYCKSYKIPDKQWYYYRNKLRRKGLLPKASSNSRVPVRLLCAAKGQGQQIVLDDEITIKFKSGVKPARVTSLITAWMESAI